MAGAPAQTASEPGLRPVDNVRGALWMLAASFFVAVTAVLMKFIATHLPVLELAFLRQIAGLFVIVPLIMKNGWRVYRTPRIDRHAVRIMFSTVSLIVTIYALATIPLAAAISLSFTRPLFMIIIAAVFLGEKAGWRRALATAVGFTGVVIVVGPSDLSFSAGVFAALAGAFCFACIMAVVRKQSATDSPATIMCWATTGICIATAVPAFVVWQQPTLTDLGIMLVIGITGATAQYMMIQAFTHGEATVVNPVDYGQIIISTLAGYFLFGERPTIWTGLGALTIISATLYILLRDAKEKRLAGRT
jgi:drug/metabolite transporter (DMT)-like permease